MPPRSLFSLLLSGCCRLLLLRMLLLLLLITCNHPPTNRLNLAAWFLTLLHEPRLQLVYDLAMLDKQSHGHEKRDCLV